MQIVTVVQHDYNGNLVHLNQLAKRIGQECGGTDGGVPSFGVHGKNIALLQYMTDGLNSCNDLDETRNWVILRLWAVVYTVIFLIAIIFILVVLVFGNSLKQLAAEYLPILTHLAKLISTFRGLIMLAILILFFDVIFTKLPNKKLTFKSQLPGAVICAVAWYIFSFGVSIYVDYFNGFSMYGSLTTIALIMLWLYFCMYIMMMCAEVNVVFNDSFTKWLKRDKSKKKA